MPTIKIMLKQLFSHAWREDKYLHLLWSFWITVFARTLWPESWVFLFVMTIGLLKEVWDAKFGSGFSFLDLVANLFGCLLALYLIRTPGSFVSHG